jgi:dTDP-4-dehydrorhamnose reductase
MKPRILLTGKNGQVGHDLQNSLPALGEVFALDRKELDLSKPDQIREMIRRIQPTVIINAAAYTAVDQAEKEESLAHVVNAEAPAIMAEEAKKIGAAVIHYSTDYVFDGTKRTPYQENDSTNPLNAYGRTKLAGEQAIQSSGVNQLIFRTAWVYSTRGKNFLLTILRLATQREELRIVSDQIGAPTWSREIASATAQVLQRIYDPKEKSTEWHDCSGTYHMTAAGETNWYEFAGAILEEARKQTSAPAEWFTTAMRGVPLITRQVIPIPTAEYPTPARRPAYSVLSNTRLQTVFGIRLPDWQTQLLRVFPTVAT